MKQRAMDNQKTPDECRPPPEHAGWPRHYLRREPMAPQEGTTIVMCWNVVYDAWHEAGSPSCLVSPTAIAAAGWHYLGPVKWDTPAPGKIIDIDKLDRLTMSEQVRLVEIAHDQPLGSEVQKAALQLLLRAMNPMCSTR